MAVVGDGYLGLIKDAAGGHLHSLAPRVGVGIIDLNLVARTYINLTLGTYGNVIGAIAGPSELAHERADVQGAAP